MNRTLIILTPGFASSENDSTCLPPQQVFVKALKENYPSLNIIILAFQYPYRKDDYLWHGARIISFNGINKRGIGKLILWLKVWRMLKKLKRENNIAGILNFWMGECALAGTYFGKRKKIKHFTWILGQDAKKGNRYFSLVKPKGSELIALSDFIAEEVYKNYKVKVEHIIPVGIDISMFDEKSERNIDILGAGSLIPLKQYDVFIRLIKKLTAHFPNIKAMICGKGEEQEHLQKLIDDLGLQNNVVLKGEVSHEDVIHLMQRSKIFLHTSSYEGFGAVCAEALYAGCHVISFCKPMQQEIDQWHITNSESEMEETALHILQNDETKYSPVLLYPADEIAKKMMSLFLPD